MEKDKVFALLQRNGFSVNEIEDFIIFIRRQVRGYFEVKIVPEIVQARITEYLSNTYDAEGRLYCDMYDIRAFSSEVREILVKRAHLRKASPGVPSVSLYTELSDNPPVSMKKIVSEYASADPHFIESRKKAAKQVLFESIVYALYGKTHDRDEIIGTRDRAKVLMELDTSKNKKEGMKAYTALLDSGLIDNSPIHFQYFSSKYNRVYDVALRPSYSLRGFCFEGRIVDSQPEEALILAPHDILSSIRESDDRNFVDRTDSFERNNGAPDRELLLSGLGKLVPDRDITLQHFERALKEIRFRLTEEVFALEEQAKKKI